MSKLCRQQEVEQNRIADAEIKRIHTGIVDRAKTLGAATMQQASDSSSQSCMRTLLDAMCNVSVPAVNAAR